MARITKRMRVQMIAERLNSSTFERSGDKLSDALRAIGQIETEHYADQIAHGLVPVEMFSGPKEKTLGRGGASKPFAPNGNVGGNSQGHEKVKQYGAADMRREDTTSERVALAEELSSYNPGRGGEKGKRVSCGSVECSTRQLCVNGVVIPDGAETFQLNGVDVPVTLRETHTYSVAMKGATNQDNRPTMPIWSKHILGMAHMRQYTREILSALKLDASKPQTHEPIGRPSDLVNLWGEIIPGIGGKQSGLYHGTRELTEVERHTPAAFGSQDDENINQYRSARHHDEMAKYRDINRRESDTLVATLQAQRAAIIAETGECIPVTYWSGGEKFSYIPRPEPKPEPIAVIIPGPLLKTSVLRPRAKWFLANPPVMAMRASA